MLAGNMKSKPNDSQTLEQRLTAIGDRAYKIGRGETVPSRFHSEERDGQVIIVQYTTKKPKE
jgi:hypothetical protein